MSDEEFADDYEHQFDDVKPLPSDPAEQKRESEHRVKLSVDIHTIKEQDFRGSVYAKYKSIPELNISHFKTSPVVELPNARVEGHFKNSFKSYVFEAGKTRLYELLNSNVLEIEVWHQDRLSSDVLIGVCTVELGATLKAPIRKTSISYTRVADHYLPIDEVDEYKKPIKKIGLLQVIVYLEDLGPVDKLKQREKELGIEERAMDKLPRDQQVITLPSQKIEHIDDPEKNRVLNELNSLEYKIIWELETWKKAEESKFKIIMKQKEMEELQKLSQEQKLKDMERQKHFKQAEASFQLLEKKLKDKAQELGRRESKIIMVEDELRSKVQETARAVSIKDDEISSLKKKLREEKANNEKEKLLLQNQVESLQNKLKAQNSEFEQYKKEQQNSPVSLVRNELATKIQEIKELQKELGREHEIKEQYKVYYEKLRNELVKQKKMFEEYKEKQAQQNQKNIQDLLQQIESLKLTQTEQINNQQQQQLLQQQQQQQFQQQSFQYTQPSQQQYQQQQQQNIKQKTVKQQQYKEYQWDKSDLTEYERLKEERDYLLQTGDYLESDPLIIELNDQIAELEQSNNNK